MTKIRRDFCQRAKHETILLNIAMWQLQFRTDDVTVHQQIKIQSSRAKRICLTPAPGSLMQVLKVCDNLFRRFAGAEPYHHVQEIVAFKTYCRVPIDR